MKRLSGIITFAVAVILCFGLPARAAEKVYTLSMTTVYFDKHPTVYNTFYDWIERIKKRSNGRIQIKYFNPNTLCPDGEVYSSVVSGAVDIGGHTHSRTPGKFPYMSVADLPMLVNSSEAGSQAAWRLYQNNELIRNEMREVKMLWKWSSAVYHIQTTSKQVKTLKDLQGMRLVTWFQPIAEILKLMGGNPIIVAPPDSYMTLQRGMAEGILTPVASMRSYKTSEVCKYTSFADLVTVSFWMGMNKDVWNSLPKDLQQIVEEESADMSRATGRMLDRGSAEDIEILKKDGQIFFPLPQGELDAIRTALQPLHETWIKTMQSKGFSEAKAVHDQMVTISAEESAKVKRLY